MLYFVRHGQTVLNTKRQFNGEFNEELNEVGLAQAKALEQKFKDENIKIDMVFCSPQIRTRQTLQGINLNKNIPVVYDNRLVERISGDLVGKPIEQNFLENVYLNINSTVKINGLETIKEAFNRVHSLLNEIKQNYKNKNVLIVSHGFIGRAVYYYFNPIPPSGKLGDKPESYPANCEVRCYKF